MPDTDSYESSENVDKSILFSITTGVFITIAAVLFFGIIAL